MPRKIKTLYFDMDGVVADFYGAAMEKFGYPRDHRFTLDCAQSWYIWKHMGVSEEEFWSRCRGHKFWETLNPIKEGVDLLHVCESIVGRENIFFLTHPSRDEGSYSGKYAWVKREFPEYLGRIIMTGKKHLLAKPGTLLIDDSDGNWIDFTFEGGVAQLVPRPWNRRWDDCLSPQEAPGIRDEVFNLLTHRQENEDE